MLIRTLSVAECAKVLAGHNLARLACAKDGRPYVVPIYYAYADEVLYAFSIPGKKIDWMRANPHVSVLVESPRQRGQWKSVIADGRYEELPERIGHKRERDHAWSLLSTHSNWWEPGALKPATPPLADDARHIFFRIVLDEVSGREAKE
ncbi:flavin-nucleotide-binding protein [Mesorhizobium sp. Root695]|jgi:nitroimidazol reductase NimA-like FMN-containing flavoprotein (pyridoxamine 5'-phosphate oxidase superfamily)|uniref:pyridoxamine 5'-phosphate oxidase family protein n=1 Tax=unclassified Mesorhizobium TaxID=325217 RepID=UPI0006FB255D|nr:MULTISPECIES: pyridoxamine 5'-phosphate oxidase family protein [unclassified Mesorhizobium]KQU92424.1 flavin-nucleotide-binding protein [Mesorhizobium sp. Root102]KRB15391.1 flavin-nucleotide-binding protein [Mesorhizobium sp. Root695]